MHTPIQSTKELKAKYTKKTGNKSHNNPAYAGMIESMDTAIGQILKTLDDLKIAGNTLVIFTSDNGPHGAFSTADPLRGSKGMYYEGGIREPFIARFPGMINADTTNDTPIHQVDLFPSLVSLADGKPDSSLDGLNILPALKGEALPERTLFWHFPAYLQGYSAGNGSASQHFRTTPCGVIRKGDWKLIEYFEDNSTELYNLKNDLSERSNLASKKPEKVKELLAKLKSWQKKTKAPIPTEKNPKFRP